MLRCKTIHTKHPFRYKNLQIKKLFLCLVFFKQKTKHNYNSMTINILKNKPQSIALKIKRIINVLLVFKNYFK